MSKNWRRLLVIIAGILVILVIIIALVPLAVVPAIARQSFPQTNGEISLNILQSPVDVYRDKMGIPQIYASNPHDLFAAQGYVHAQERFWQMDFWRHIGSGRLSEMFGESQVDTDAFLRSLGWRQLAEQEYDGLPPDVKADLDAYAEGVNAYLETHQGTSLSLEYGVLSLLNPQYRPEPWTPVHSLTWAKVMAWDLSGNMDTEIERSILLKSLSQEQVDELYPPYPDDHPVIVPKIGDLTSETSMATSAPETQNQIFQAPARELEAVAGNFRLLDSVLGPRKSSLGSNSWAVSGKLTASGKPLLANDALPPEE